MGGLEADPEPGSHTMVCNIAECPDWSPFPD
jgi:hypothetical protein